MTNRNSTWLKWPFAGLLGIGVLLLAPAPACSASSEDLLLRAACMHPVTGPDLVPGEVLVRDGKIAAVGQNLEAAQATVVNLANQHLYPGMIALNTVLGLAEISGVRATLDNQEVGEFTPDVESWIAVNPDSELLPVARANGIACFEPVPQGGVVSGQSALIAMDGWTTEQRTIKRPIALHVFWPSMELASPTKSAASKNPVKSYTEQARERRARLQDLDQFFDEARAYAKARETDTNDKHPRQAMVPAWEAMLPVARGELPVTVHADEIRQIRSALAWAERHQLKIALAGGRDAALAADLLALHQVPVIFAHTFSQPARDDQSYDILFQTPEILRRAGVQVAFSMGADPFNATMVRDLPYAAAQSVAFGLPADAALKGLTLYPARIAGVADRLGSLEPGKEATLFAADGDILDARSNVSRMWLAGREVKLGSRHTALYERYRNRPRASPAN